MHMRLFTLILLLILISLCGYTWINREELISPCLPPLRYAVETVDPRFQLSKKDFTALITQSEYLWEKALGKNIFQYDPQASFTINLVYDERQSKTNQGLQLEQEIDSKKETYEQLTEKLNTDTETYKKLLAQYNALFKSYEESSKKYQKDLLHWNSSDRTSEKEHDALQKSFEKLEQQRLDINTLSEHINSISQSSEHLISNINSTAKKINDNVDMHNNLFGENPEFDKGVFVMNAINIYQFTNREDLLITLAHEMGHSIHIREHTEDPKSIMHYLMKDQPTNPVTLTPQDINSANHACRFDIHTPKDFLKLFLSGPNSRI